MIFGKFLNLYKNPIVVIASAAKQSMRSMDCRVASLLAMTLLVLINPANAQDPGYAPPPMFDDMTPPMVRPQGQDGYLVTPKSSTNTRIPEATPQRAPIVTPRVSVDPDKPRPAIAPTVALPVAPQAMPIQTPTPPPAAAVMPAPAPAPAPVVVPEQLPTPVVPAIAPPPVKPQQAKPIVEETYIKRQKPAPKKPKKTEEPRTEEVKKPVAPVPPPAAEKTEPPAPSPSVEAPVIKSAPRDPSQSAIQGPKTMPALPAQNVDSQVVFDQEAPPAGETILERHQKEVEKETKTLMPIIPAPNPNVRPAAFDKAEQQNALKKSIPFQPGQIGLPDADADPIIAGVVKELDDEEKADWRVQIRSFATPHGDGLSSDRRISLSRALSLRSSMIAQGVPASRIDVMAEGLQTDPSKPGDRIDLYLYGPAGQ